MQLAFLDFEAAFDSPHRGRLLNALRADGVPGKFVPLLDDMNQRTTAACTDDVVIFAESSTKLQHVVNLVSKLAAAYGLRLRPDKCKQMWISSRPGTGIRVDEQPIGLVDEFCYLGCTLKNNGSYERDGQQRCAKAISAFDSLTRCLWSTPITNEVKLRVYLSAIRPIMMYGSETWAAPLTVKERLDCTERKLLRRLLGYFWPVTIKIFTQKLMCRPADSLVQRVLRSSSGSNWKKPPDRKRKFWTEVVKEELMTLGVGRQFRRDKIEKVGQSCVQGRHTSAKMRVIVSGDDISPPIKSSKSLPHAMDWWMDRDDIAAVKLIETEDLSGDGFLLAFVDTNAKKYLERYGHRGIVFDDAFNEYFQELNPQYVMTDDTYVFYNTFKAVFPASRAAKVFCSCHISQALQRKHKELLKCVRGGSDMSWRRKRNVQRHKEALMRYKDAPAAITKATENLWKVVSSCRNGVAYEVTINDSPCDCSEERLTMKTERKRNGKKFIDDDSDLEEEARNILQTDRKLLQNCFICGKRNPDANDDD
ncbi:hypothetical protein RB195_023295 [Necator americanus]|uniref:Reverse transcriptase domain-containing protein n=1 Tax=Necator americanus TaxID=51031 RepID=A0ABR1EJ57_NECAM